MRRWFAASLLLLSCAVFALPESPAAAIPDFFGTIADFVGSVNTRIYGWVKERWMDYMYGDYRKLLEYDLGGISSGPAESYLSHPVDRGDYFQFYAASSVDRMQAAYSAAGLAAAQRAACILLYSEREACERSCPSAYEIKACTDAFFTYLNSATSLLNESFDYAVRQMEADYNAYLYYGMNDAGENKLSGCYLSVVDVYNDFYAFRGGGMAQAEKVRSESDLGDRMVVAFSSLERSPRFYNRFFNAIGGGRDAVVFQMLNQHQECRKIEDAVHRDFAEKAASFYAKLADRSAELETIRRGGLCDITQQDLDAIFSGDELEVRTVSMQIAPEYGAAVSNPARACALASGELSNLTALKARILAGENANRFLLRASEELDAAEAEFGRIDGNIRLIRVQSEGIADRARERAVSLHLRVSGYRGSIPGEGEQKALLLSEFDAMLEKADSATGAAADAGTEGGRARGYSSAIMHLLAIEASFGPMGGSGGPTLSSAAGMLALAKEDGLETSREAAFIENAKANSKAGRDRAAAAFLQGAVAGIAEKAGGRYFGLEGMRARIKSELSFLSEAGVPVDSSGFARYEGFFTDGSLDVSKAVGNLRRMEAEYALLDERLAGAILQNQSALLSATLSKKRPEIVGDVVAGEPAQVLLDLGFTNPLPYALDPKAVAVPLKYVPAGRISSRDVVSASHAEVAQEGDSIVLFVDGMAPGSSFNARVMYDSVVAQAGRVEVEEAHTQKNAVWRFSVRAEAPPGTEKLLVEVPPNKHLLANFPRDFVVSGGRQYLAILHPQGRYGRVFSTPGVIEVDRKVGMTEALQSPRVRVSERVTIRNGIDQRLGAVRIELPLYVPVEDLGGGVLEGPNAVFSVSLSPRETKMLDLNYTVNDPKFYSEVLISETGARLSVIRPSNGSSLSGEVARLRERRESGSRLYAEGDYVSAISELVSIVPDAERLENNARQDSSLREAFLRLNASFSERIGGLKEISSISRLLGIPEPQKNPVQLEDARSRANREFFRGDAALASELLQNASARQMDEKAVMKALESKRAELSLELDNLTRLRAAVSAVGIKDAALGSLAENLSAAHSRFSLAVSGRNYSGAREALEELNAGFAVAGEQWQRVVSGADGIALELLANRSREIESAERELASIDYGAALSLHLPPAVGAWARENGIVDESAGLAKVSAGLQEGLADEKRAISAALNATPLSRLMFVGSGTTPGSVGPAREFAGNLRNIMGRKGGDAAAGIERSEALLGAGRLESSAGTLVSSARRAQAAGRFQDSIAYTAYATAVFSREPPSSARYVAALLLAIAAVFAYANRCKASGGREDRLGEAERRISLGNSL